MTVQEAVWVLSILGGILFLGAGFFLSSFLSTYGQRKQPSITADIKAAGVVCHEYPTREDDKPLTVIHGYLSDILWMVERELRVHKNLAPATSSTESASGKQIGTSKQMPSDRRTLIHEIKNNISDLQSSLSLIFELRRQEQLFESTRAKDSISFLGDKTFQDQRNTLADSLTRLLADFEMSRKIDHSTDSEAILAVGLDRVLDSFLISTRSFVKKVVVLDGEGFSLSGIGATEEELKQLALSVAMLIADSVRGQRILYSEEWKFSCYQGMENTMIAIYRIPLSLKDIFLAIQVQNPS